MTLSRFSVCTRGSLVKIRTYSELKELKTFSERFEYLKLGGSVGESTFGFDRYLNQKFYLTPEWKKVRNEVILRDSGCDLGDPDHPLFCKLLIHHMNPITADDIIQRKDYILNPDFLITTCLDTHNAIHYGTSALLSSLPVERTPNDTCPWRL